MTNDTDHLKKHPVDTLEGIVNSMAASLEKLTKRHQIALRLLQKKISQDENGLLSSYAYKKLTLEQKTSICNGDKPDRRIVAVFKAQAGDEIL